MQNLHRFTLATIFMVPLVTLSHAETYLCIGEVSGGIHHKNDKWQGQVFTVVDDNFIIKKNINHPEDYTYKNLKKGSEYELDCKKKVGITENIVCGDFDYFIEMKLENLRYIEVSTGLYTLDSSAKQMKSIIGESFVLSSGSITGGTCTLVDKE